jgi:nitroreductase
VSDVAEELINIIKGRRTIRLYEQRDIASDDLKEMVDAARFAPSARNVQPLEYIIIDSDGPLDEMFSCMGFGGGIDENDFEERKPRAYVVVLVNKDIPSNWYEHDSGMAVQNLMLAAWSKGIASCVLAKINRNGIRELLGVPDNYEIDLVITLGYPAEKSVVEDVGKNEDISYSRDSQGTLHIPKKRIEDVMHRNGF